MKLRYDDQSHAYWLDGVRCKSVTTVAKIPDDTYNLEQWGNRQVAIGLAMKPDLVQAVAAHVEDRDKLNELCQQAREIAGANDASRRGTAAHRITELHDQGKDVIATELATSILASWTEVLDAAGLEVVPEWMERIVVFPEHRICGKFDRIVRRKRDGALVIADLKTGERAIKYPHSIAVQMALYANAPAVAAELPPSGGTTEDFSPLPDGLDRNVGYIIHIPEMGTASVAEVDIAGGWEVARDVCFPVLRWRKRGDLVRPITIDPPEEGPPAPPPVDLTDVRAGLQKRIDALRAHGADALEHIARLLQANEIPSLKKSDAHTDEQLILMDKLIAKVEAEHVIPFPVPNQPPAAPEPEPPVEDVPLLPAATIDEGGPTDAVTMEAARKAYEEAGEPCRLWIKTIATEATQAGYPIHLKDHPTVRRVEILRTLLAAWKHEGDNDLCRAVLTTVTGEVFARQQTIPLGACFGVLTIDEARRAAACFDHLADGTAVVRFLDNGVMTIDDAAEAA